MLTSTATTGASAFEAELQKRFGPQFADLPVRCLHFAQAACQATSRPDAFDRALGVAGLLLVQGADPETVAAAIVSQAIPEADLDLDAIQANFGAELASLLRGLSRAGRIETLNSKGVDIEQLRKMLLAIAEDVRVVLIKLAERVVYLRSITKADDALRRAAGKQTLALFAPLANRLGVSEMKWELEDYAFRFQEPDVYKKIAQLLDEKRNDREAYIQRVIATLRQELDALGIQATIQGRPKHIYSIWRKMGGKNVGFEQLYDIRAVRVIVPSIRECYTVLGIVHDLWTPVEGEFDDYIASPKANNYRSLHTAVVGPEGQTLEVQVRTEEMHQHSEHGVAAHWRYKEGGRADRKFDTKIAWLRQVLAWKSELAGGADRERASLFEDTIYVLTPQGKVVDLPAGSTPLDFAYHVHTDLGHRCRGAKVDGHMVPLDYHLRNAQTVEIMSTKQGGPSRDWLSPQLGYLASPRALAKVRQWFRHEDFEKDAAEGRTALEKELQRLGSTGFAHDRVAGGCGFDKLEEFLAALGRGEVTSRQIEIAVRGEAPVAPAGPIVPITPAASSGRTSSGVLVLGVNNIATLMAKCCKPVPPDPIIGFITRTRGVMVHRQDCTNITGLREDQRDRLMPAEWGKTGDAPFSADFEVVAKDRQGLLRDISDAISRERINVTGVNTLSRGAHAYMRFTLQVSSSDSIQRVLRAVKDVPGVDTARRL
ncbi:RelA/SpoT family protein [Usitatibacter palustris]|uniref:GTP pyrophosphokinase n=1 Tax=Usitatibacter palustris TaxID=2732487 RepID=A0A6M4H9C8_9PROT|nr:bifunctional (p)ppGpp synthetase/guanosine-3',5'-bis(diphosphate) 3'-pyrophosphohydrolase [Usitatibacter palustris]QJR15448.1 GTP pyrophosphokinase [Usitatibacter palustris]